LFQPASSTAAWGTASGSCSLSRGLMAVKYMLEMTEDVQRGPRKYRIIVEPANNVHPEGASAAVFVFQGKKLVKCGDERMALPSEFEADLQQWARTEISHIDQALGPAKAKFRCGRHNTLHEAGLRWTSDMPLPQEPLQVPCHLCGEKHEVSIG
jgi:hypothetical protein